MLDRRELLAATLLVPAALVPTALVSTVAPGPAVLVPAALAPAAALGQAAALAPAARAAAQPGDDRTLLRALLALEHAAVYAYGRFGPVLAAPLHDLARRRADVHRLQRDALRSALLARRAEAPPPEVAYALPVPVRDAASALAAGVAVEQQALDGYHATLPLLGEAGLRGLCAQLLAQAAVGRCELELGAGRPAGSVTQAFPGRD